MRRDVRCASAVTVDAADATIVNGTTMYKKISATLPARCPTAGERETTVVYETEPVAEGRFRLRRAGVRIADHLTASHVFSYVPASMSTLGRLTVDIPVNVEPDAVWKRWRLTSDIVLRNTF